MLLNIIKLTEKKSLNIDWLDIQTPVGNFVIQEDHAPTILTLKQNSKVTYLQSNGQEESIQINHGIVHITRSFITLLID